MAAELARGLAMSRAALNADYLDSAVIEPDLKRTRQKNLLIDLPAVTAFYECAAELVASSGAAKRTFAYCHSPAHLLASLASTSVAGHAAQYNTVESWPERYFDRVSAFTRPFVGMAPLWRGRLVIDSAVDAPSRLAALRWALRHPAVRAVVVTMSTPQHFYEVMETMERYEQPLDPDMR